jgi:hypothetical protein
MGSDQLRPESLLRRIQTLKGPATEKNRNVCSPTVNKTGSKSARPGKSCRTCASLHVRPWSIE